MCIIHLEKLEIKKNHFILCKKRIIVLLLLLEIGKHVSLKKKKKLKEIELKKIPYILF